MHPYAVYCAFFYKNEIHQLNTLTLRNGEILLLKFANLPSESALNTVKKMCLFYDILKLIFETKLYFEKHSKDNIYSLIEDK